MSRSRTTALAVASTLIALLGLEVVARVLLAVLPDSNPGRTAFAFEDVWAHADDPLHAPDRERFWKPVPGRSSGEVRINAQGLRGPELPVAKPAGIRRILLLGDSVTFGYGVSEAESFAGRLRQVSGSNVEVINAGVTGYSSWQGLRHFEGLARDYRPDVLIAMFGYNDHHSALWSDRDKYARRHLEAAARVAAHAATFRLLARVRTRLSSGDVQHQPVARVDVEAFAANLAAIDSLARAAGCQALFLTVPIRPAVPLVENFVQVQDPEAGSVWVRQIDLACQQMDPPACEALTRCFFENADWQEFTRVDGACARTFELTQLAPELPVFHYLMAECHAARGDSAAAAIEHAAAARLDRERAIMQTYNSRLRDLARTRRLAVLDAAAFAEEASEPLFLDVVHPNNAGHARLATLIASEIRRREWLP